MEGRGWNDTPQILNQNPTGKLKINLNKRVAFPLQKGPSESAITSSQQVPTGSLPPPFTQVLPPAIPSLSQSDVETDKSDNLFNPNIEIGRISKVLQECLPTINQPSVQSSVKSKIKSLEDDWNLCDIELQKLLVQLVEFIEKKDAKGAGGVQRKIIMQGYNKQWMHGIRQIILNLESQNESQE